MCIDSNQCEDEMICMAENMTKVTTGTGFNRNTNNNHVAAPTKICLCDEELGYVEDVQDSRCNSGKFS